MQASAKDDSEQGVSLWEKHCGFIHKPLRHFMTLQDRLLEEQIDYIHSCGLWKTVAGNLYPLSPQEFRETVPLTTYEDYREIFMGKREELLPGKVKVWAQTTGSTGDIKLIPYTETFYIKHGGFLIGAVALSSSTGGHFPVKPGDIFFCTVAPPPYASGLAAKAAAEELGLLAFPPLDSAEHMSFTSRIVTGFMMALEKGRIDAIGGVASVLVNIGEMFDSKIGDYLVSDDPPAWAGEKVVDQFRKQRSEGRPLLPKDIFKPKVILCGGSGVRMSADAIEEYWGKRPSECYAMTEVGQFAVQPCGQEDMVFVPNLAYFEFIPERDYDASQPKTCLINELETGSRYEPVVTNFHGGCLFRYRTGDLIEVVSQGDAESGSDIPRIRFFSRAENVINLGGVVKLNEEACWRLIQLAEINHGGWFAVQEESEAGESIRFYLETHEPEGRILEGLKQAASKSIATFDEVPEVLGYNPIKVSTLTHGVFAHYMTEMEAAGADLGKVKPMYLKPGNEQVERVRQIDTELRASA